MRDLSEQVSRLVRLEAQLARAEIAEKVREIGMSVAFFIVAALGAFMVLSVLTAAAVLGLSEVLPGWAAALIVAGAWLVIAAGMGLLGRSALKKGAPPVPEQTIETLKEDVRWAKSQRVSAGT